MNVFYFVKRALRNIAETPFINLVTIGTVAIAMLMFGSFLLLMVNLRSVVDRIGGDVQISAYLYEDVPAGDALAFRDRVHSIPAVQRVEYISKDDALASFQAEYPEDAALVQVLEDNPLPASLEIHTAPGYRDAQAVRSLVADLRAHPLVEEVAYGQDWIDKFSSFLGLLRGVGVALGTLLILAIIVIVSNTIRLSVYARREELEIMRLVGATKFFIRTPYLIEGTLQGGLGAAFAVITLWGLFYGLGAEAGAQAIPVLGIEHLQFLPGNHILGMVGGGLGMGLFGSLFSLGRFLR